MDDEITISADVLFGRVEIHDAAPRIDGEWLYPRSRIIEYGMRGQVMRDEIVESGIRVTNWEECWWMFGAPAPTPKPWWKRLWEQFC